MENDGMEHNDAVQRNPRPQSVPPEYERLRFLAYQLWQARGCPFGSPDVDWFQAENQIRTDQEPPNPDTTIITVAKTIGSVLGSVASLLSPVGHCLSS